MRDYEGKHGTQEESSNKDTLLNDLFVNSDAPDLVDTDETLEVPTLSIDLDDVDKRTEERAKIITERLSDYYFDQKYIDNHPYIKNKIAQEMDNIRRLLKMLTVNEKAQDTLIMSITINAGKGTLYGSLTSLQNSMLQMQTQLNQLTANLENIFKEMQENCEQTFEEKSKEENDDGTLVVQGSKNFIEEITRTLGKSENKIQQTN
jgi:hypothetical protein